MWLPTTLGVVPRTRSGNLSSHGLGRGCYQGKKKHININKFAGLSWDWVGAENLFMCFFGSFLMGENKHINKIPPQIPGQSREIFVYVFLSLCVFFAPHVIPLRRE